MSRLLKLLPEHERSSKVFIDLMETMAIELDLIHQEIENTLNQLNPDTATWRLALLEKELGIPINPDLSLDTRRSLIKSRLLMQPPGSKVNLTNVIRGFAKSTVITEYFSEYIFKVGLSMLDELGSNLVYIKEILENSKPAHLDYVIELKIKQDTPEYRIGAGTVYGESVLIYPLIKTEIIESAKVKRANHINTSDDTSIWPILK